MTTQMNDPLAPEKTEDAVPRDRWGRPKILQPDGSLEPYTRCTTFVKALEGDASALALWKQRMTALGLNARPDLLMAVATAGDGATTESKQALNKIVEAAAEAAAASSAATIGTALHKFTERIDRGEPMGQIPAAFVPDLQAYMEVTRQLRAVQVEQFGVHDEMRVAGTWDRQNELNGRLYIGDVKTGRVDDLSIGKISMQLAIYSRCKLYNPVTGERTPQDGVDQDRAIIISLPAGTGKAELFWVDIASGWQAVQLAARARKWQGWAKMKNLAEPLILQPPVADVAPTAVETIRIPEGRTAESVIQDTAAAVGVGDEMLHNIPVEQPGPDHSRIEKLAEAVSGQINREDAAARALEQQQVAAVSRGEGPPEADVALLVAINSTATLEGLIVLWQQTGASWTDEHKAAASRRRAELGG